MKNTKEITTGAMLLAIYGALLLIDRQFSFFLIEIIALAVPVLIIMFGNMYNLKDGIYFSIAILLLALIISPNPYSYFYIPVGILIGNSYNFMLNKGIKSKVILLVIIILFAIADFCYMFTISPLFIGIGFDDLINETAQMFNMFLKIMPVEFTIDMHKIVEAFTYASLLLTSVMEGFIVHILVFFLFKRFRINKMSFNAQGILMLKPVPAYLLLIGSAMTTIAFRIENDTITSIMYVVGSICMFILMYYGYIYLLMLIRLRANRSMTFVLILGIIFLFPTSLIVLMVVGFLYGAGPLKKYLIPKQGGIQ